MKFKYECARSFRGGKTGVLPEAHAGAFVFGNGMARMKMKPLSEVPMVSSATTRRPQPITFALLCCLAATLAVAQEYTATPPSEITAAVKPFVADRSIAGCVALVANRDQLLCLEPVGSADLDSQRPMRADSFFWIASMTKAHACAAFMMLVDAGKVQAQDPVEKYFPEYKGQQVGTAGSRHAPAHPITLRECMTHTAGLADPKNKNKSLRENVADWGKLPLKYEPGQSYHYHLGVDIAGGVIEVLSGMSFADFMQKRLFEPLEMKDATFFPSQEQLARLARPVQMKADKSGIENMDPKAGFQNSAVIRSRIGWPTGGMFATAPDVMKFCQMLLNEGAYKGQRILSAAAVREMTSNQIPGVGHYGYGLNTVETDGAFSAGSFNHRGALGTHMWVDKKRQLVLVLLIQYKDMGPKEVKLCEAFTTAALGKYGQAYKAGEGQQQASPGS
jgi:CubicO group peptidase (beta-lactamase class C family)